MPRSSRKAVKKRKPLSPTARMAAYRRRMRRAGLRPVQIWVPDAKAPAFAAQCRAQSLALARHDPAGDEILRWAGDAYEWPQP